MKKLFSLVLVVVLAATMVLGTAAADTVLLEGSNGTIDLSAVVEGDTLEIVAEFDGSNADVAAGWGVGGLCLDGSWSVASGYECTLEATPAAGDRVTFTFDASAVKAAATGDVNVNMYNGFTPVTVTLKSVVVEEGGAEGDDSAQTGDMMNVALLAGVAALAFVAVVASKKANA